MYATAAAFFAAFVAIGCGALWRLAQQRLRAQLAAVDQLERDGAEAQTRAQQARNEMAKLREMLDALPMPVWRRGRDQTIVDCNEAYAAALGTSREAVLAAASELADCSRLTRSVPPADDPVRHLHLVLNGERRPHDLCQVGCSDGETIGFAVDRTETENAQRQLRRHIGAHGAVLETLAAAVAIFGPDKHLKFFNSAFSDFWGLDPAWLASEPKLGELLEHLHEGRRFPEYPDFRAFKKERCALFTSLIEPQRELMHLPDGRTLQLVISPHPFGGLIFVFDDVSDRLALECSYNTLAQVQRATLDHLFEGIAVYGGDGRLKLHNPAFRALWGLSEADIAGEPHIAEIVERTRELVDDGGDWTSMRDEMVAQVTSQTLASGPLYRRDGSVLQVASVPLPDGEVLLTYLDVTDSVRIERALRERNEALETAARLKAEFVANLSHELRTPLNTITGFGEILHNQYFGPLNSSQREYSGGILDSAHQLMALISDVIDLASIEASYLELERSPVDVAGLLRALVALTGERARSRGLEIELRCPANLGAIDGDERRLKQAMFNLISNAIKFTPPGGAIRIEAERCGGELGLSVCETAPSFAAAVSSEVFERFERVRAQSSTSLGLSLVKSLVELHGGRVEIESAPRQGTRVTCRLPVGRPEAGGVEPKLTAGPGREASDSSGAAQARTAPSSAGTA
jgi:signal transduction histidine kinase